MTKSQSTADLDSQIAKLEEKLNNLLDRVQQAQANPEQSVNKTDETKINTQTRGYNNSQSNQVSSRKSRQEILAEYEIEYLARLEENSRAQEEIRRTAAELEEKNKALKQNSTRGSLPKGF